jgi:hypothetical protein
MGIPNRAPLSVSKCQTTSGIDPPYCLTGGCYRDCRVAAERVVPRVHGGTRTKRSDLRLGGVPFLGNRSADNESYESRGRAGPPARRVFGFAGGGHGPVDFRRRDGLLRVKIATTPSEKRRTRGDDDATDRVSHIIGTRGRSAP